MQQKSEHESWLLRLISFIGVVCLLVMGGVNYFFDNQTLGLIELGLGVIGFANSLFYAWKRNMTLASHVILSSMGLLLSFVIIDGGIKDTGWLWVFVYPPLAFALRNVKTASWYVSTLGFFIAGVCIGKLQGFDWSPYSLVGLIQLCTSYGVVSLMVSFAERAHEKIEVDYERQGNELANERTLLWQQRDQLRVFKTAVEQSGEMMILTDPEGIVLWGNRAAEEVTGFTTGEMIGKKAGVLWGKLMDRSFYEQMWQRIKSDKKLYVGEIQNHRKNGEKFFSTINIYPLLDQGGLIQYFVATQRDITQQKEVDQMKTDFISLVSHQMRTPMTSMRWNLEMLEGGDLGLMNPEQTKVIKQVSEANARMIKLISTLLNISRIESGRLIVEPIELDMAEYISTLAKNCQSNVRGQEIETDLPSEACKVMVDPMLLRQILNNFMNNASKYSPVDKKITIQLRDKGESYQLSVIDRGYGIPAADQRKIFGKFFRGSNVRQYEADGTGMGLYIGSMIAKLLGGKIGFESRENEGSRFFVILPKKGVEAKAGEVKLI